MRNLVGLTMALALAATFPVAALAVTPITGASPGSPIVTINASPGQQNDPHVSGDLAAYTDQAVWPQIRYYDFATSVDTPISNLLPGGGVTFDLLSDVSGPNIVFTRQNGTDSRIMDFNTTTSTLTEIDPAPAPARMGAAIGGNTVAYVDISGRGDIVAWDLATSTRQVVSAAPAFESNPNVSPDGNVIVWEYCVSSTVNCDVYQAVMSGGAWAVSPTANTPTREANPDTDGTTVVYEADRAGSLTGQDIYYRSVSGGAETQIELPGMQRNPSISHGVVAFESVDPITQNADVYVYIIASNTLLQVTHSPTENETLNDVTVLGNGDVRLVWAANDVDVVGTTFTPPSISIQVPADGAFYGQLQTINADYVCAGSTLASCIGPVPNGSPIDTSTPGVHTFTVTATDTTGATSSLTHTYSVCSLAARRAYRPCAPRSWTVGEGLWAVSDGSTVLRGGGVAGFQHLGAGRYVVGFRPANVSGCAYIATAGSPSGTNGDAAVSTFGAPSTGVYVETRSPSAGGLLDMPFSLVVECDPADKDMRFAVVDAAGGLVNGSTGSTASGGGSGITEIATTRQVSQCGLLATLGDTGSGPVPAPGYVYTATGHQSVNGVYVETKNPGGGLSPYPFHQVAYCNKNANAARRFAVVSDTGTLVRGSKGAAAHRIGRGLYDVTFKGNVRACAYVATIGDVANGLVFAPATVNTYPGPTPRSVRVRIQALWFFGGGASDRPFHLGVAC